MSGQAAFSKLLELSAAGEISRAQSDKAYRETEVAKLGATGTPRVSAVTSFVQAVIPDPDLVKAVLPNSANAVKAWEKIMEYVRTQGAGSFSQQHRTTETPGKVSDAEYEAMTFAEKRQYAAKFGNPTTQPAANGRA